MLRSREPFTVAAAQAAPVFMDRERTVEKACDLIAEAARSGAELVVFPEAFIPGYPDWVWLVPNGRGAELDALYAELLANAVSVPDESTQKLCRAAKRSGIHVAIGVNERNAEASNASLYNTLLFIDADGNIMGRHRKLVPTGGERLVWARGDGSTLSAFDTPFAKLGGLICWENYMPLARYAMYAEGVQVLAAPTWDKSESWLSSLSHIAREGGAYVVSCCQALRMEDIPDRFEFKKAYPAGRTWVNQGNSCIVDPNGRIVAGPVAEAEQIIHAEVDPGLIVAAKRMFDVAGHYARPDVFRIEVDRR